MQQARLGRVGLAAAVVAIALGVSPAGAATTRQIPAGGVSTITGGVFGSGALQFPEFAGQGESGAGPAPYSGTINDRSKSREHGNQNQQGNNDGEGNGTSGDRSTLKLSFDGLNFRQQRTARGGNQFSLEPPDQGMCAGNGVVLETVNDVVRVYHQADGSPATPVADLNSFYGYPAAINRATGERGPFVTDPSCLFDQKTQRWFNVVLTLEVKAKPPGAGAFLGPNHLDIAVSQSADPTGAWTIYRIPVQDDGTDGTPNHGCAGGPCIGDYPHIGADASGFYITTNEYALTGAQAFHAAQIYAFSKARLASGAASVGVTQIDTVGMVDTGSQIQPGFTVWPAQSPGTAGGGGQNGQNGGGIEYLLSSNAGDEATTPGGLTPGPRTSKQVILWTLAGTQSLDSSSPSLKLVNKVLRVPRYGVPPRAEQKAGDFPLGQCINDTTMPTPFGPGCWQFLFVSEPAHNEVLSHLDSNDTRMQQVTYANGKVWGALDTALTVRGENKAGIEYFAVSPQDDGGRVDLAGYIGLANNNLIYPAIGMTEGGRGVMAFTVVGNDYYPSAGYAAIDASGAGAVHIAAPGAGPTDGFTGYKAEVGDPPRPRWGDYGAAAVDGNTVWIGSEYIAQTCTLAQYVSAPFGSCGGTRATLGNWATRISAVQP